MYKPVVGLWFGSALGEAPAEAPHDPNRGLGRLLLSPPRPSFWLWTRFMRIVPVIVMAAIAFTFVDSLAA
jgi:hypothetical protein